MERYQAQDNYGLTDNQEVYRLVYRTQVDPYQYHVLKVFDHGDDEFDLVEYRFTTNLTTFDSWQEIEPVELTYQITPSLIGLTAIRRAVIERHTHLMSQGVGWSFDANLSEFVFLSEASPRPMELGLTAYAPEDYAFWDDEHPIEIRVYDPAENLVAAFLYHGQLEYIDQYFPELRLGFPGTPRLEVRDGLGRLIDIEDPVQTPSPGISELRVPIEVDTGSFEDQMHLLESSIGQTRQETFDSLNSAIQEFGIMVEEVLSPPEPDQESPNTLEEFISSMAQGIDTGEINPEQFYERFSAFREQMEGNALSAFNRELTAAGQGTMDVHSHYVGNLLLSQAAGPQVFYEYLVTLAKHANPLLNGYITRFLKLWNPEQIGYKVFDQIAQDVKRRAEQQRENRRREREAKTHTRARYLELP